MIDSGHENSKEVKEILGQVNRQWEELYKNSVNQSSTLNHASQIGNLNKSIDDSIVSFDSLVL